MIPPVKPGANSQARTSWLEAARELRRTCQRGEAVFEDASGAGMRPAHIDQASKDLKAQRRQARQRRRELKQREAFVAEREREVEKRWEEVRQRADFAHRQLQQAEPMLQGLQAAASKACCRPDSSSEPAACWVVNVRSKLKHAQQQLWHHCTGLPPDHALSSVAHALEGALSAMPGVASPGSADAEAAQATQPPPASAELGADVLPQSVSACSPPSEAEAEQSAPILASSPPATHPMEDHAFYSDPLAPSQAASAGVATMPTQEAERTEAQPSSPAQFERTRAQQHDLHVGTAFGLPVPCVAMADSQPESLEEDVSIDDMDVSIDDMDTEYPPSAQPISEKETQQASAQAPQPHATVRPPIEPGETPDTAMRSSAQAVDPVDDSAASASHLQSAADAAFAGTQGVSPTFIYKDPSQDAPYTRWQPGVEPEAPPDTAMQPPARPTDPVDHTTASATPLQSATDEHDAHTQFAGIELSDMGPSEDVLLAYMLPESPPQNPRKRRRRSSKASQAAAGADACSEPHTSAPGSTGLLQGRSDAQSQSWARAQARARQQALAQAQAQEQAQARVQAQAQARARAEARGVHSSMGGRALRPNVMLRPGRSRGRGRSSAPRACDTPAAPGSTTVPGGALDAAVQQLRANASAPEAASQAAPGGAEPRDADMPQASRSAGHMHRALPADHDVNAGGRSKRNRNPGQRAAAMAAIQDDAPSLLAFLQGTDILDSMQLLGPSIPCSEGVGDDEQAQYDRLHDILDQLFHSSGKAAGKHQGDMTPEQQQQHQPSGHQRYCLHALRHLVELASCNEAEGPQPWGWCRELRAFIFVFDKANRIVWERPEYGHATYFFELEHPLPVADQVQRLIRVLSVKGMSYSILMDADEQSVAGLLDTDEMHILRSCGWVAGSGLAGLLNFAGERIFHRFSPGTSTEELMRGYKQRIVKMLQQGSAGGRFIKPFNLDSH